MHSVYCLYNSIRTSYLTLNHLSHYGLTLLFKVFYVFVSFLQIGYGLLKVKECLLYLMLYSIINKYCVK